MKLWVYVLVVLVLTSTLSPGILTVLSADDGKPLVVATTTVLASVVKDLAGDVVDVEVVASPAVCPAHYDVKPSDVDKFRRASLILYHGFEPWVDDLYKASGSKAPLVRISGPWNTPEALKNIYEKVAEALEEYLGINVSARLSRCLEAIDETARWLKDFARQHGFEGVPVVVMLWQKPFITYLGFRVVAVFRPPEKVTPKELEEVIANASRAGAVLVIDNLQSGTDLGTKIAREIGAVEVALTNFPGTAPEITNVTEMMKYNAILLARALEEAKAIKNASELKHELARARSEARMWMHFFFTSLAINVALATLLAIAYRRLKRV